MRDSELRGLEGRVRNSNLPSESALWVLQKLRWREFTFEMCELAAFCGHQGARVICGREFRPTPTDAEGWVHQVKQFGDLVASLVGVICTSMVVRIADEDPLRQYGVRNTVIAAINLLKSNHETRLLSNEELEEKLPEVVSLLEACRRSGNRAVLAYNLIQSAVEGPEGFTEYGPIDPNDTVDLESAHRIVRRERTLSAYLYATRSAFELADHLLGGRLNEASDNDTVPLPLVSSVMAAELSLQNYYDHGPGSLRGDDFKVWETVFRPRIEQILIAYALHGWRDFASLLPIQSEVAK